jgi:uncharacterized phosphosugar-binding protein
VSAKTYFSEAIGALQRVADTQLENVAAAAELMVNTIVSDGTIYSFGASHSFMITEELVYRTGGLMLVNPIYPHGMNTLVRPITATSRLERLPGLGRELLHTVPARAGDLLLLTSTSGRNAVAIDMALAARERDMKIIGVTALAYTRAVTSRHPSGKKMAELCNVVLDNGAPEGDAVVAIAGCPQKVGPVSSVTGCALANALISEVVARLVQRGMKPPVYMSANLDGGDAHNARLLAENRHRIHYLD